MNDLSNLKVNEKTMTVQEVAKALNVAERTVRNSVARLYPKKMKKGVPTRLNEEQVTRIKQQISRHHNVARTGHVAFTELEREEAIALGEKLKAEKGIQSDDISIAQIENMHRTVGATIQKLKNHENRLEILEANQSKRIEIEDDYFEALGYSLRKNMKLNQSTLAIIGRACSKLSRERNIEIRKNPHSRYGTVNVYHKSILDQVFSDFF